MAELLLCSFPAGPFDVDGRTLVGRVIPYGTIADVEDEGMVQREQVRAGAFRRSITERAERIPLYAGHPAAYPPLGETMPVGRSLSWDDQADALYGVFRLSDTSGGRDAGALVREGLVTGLSVGFFPDPRTRRVDPHGVVTHRDGRLHHVALVMEPAYPGAEVLSVRAGINRPRRSLRPLAAQLAALALEET